MKLEILTTDVDIAVIAVVRHLGACINQLLTLPDVVEVEFRQLDGGVYAQSHLSYRFRNRLVLNSILNQQEIMLPFVHEMIHIQQQHLGHLRCTSAGSIIWRGQTFRDIENLTYEQYQALPWESDAFAQQFPILKRCLELSRQRS